MLLETIRLEISPEIFDIHFIEFIREWNDLIFEYQQVGNVRIRYGVYYQERETTENKNLLAEVEVTSVSKDQIEVRIALVELDRGYSYDFVPALGRFIDSKWHDHLILDDYDNWDLRKGLGNLKQILMEKYGFNNLDDLSSPVKPPEGIDEKRAALVVFMHKNLRLSLQEELQKRLQPIDQLPGYLSSGTKAAGRKKLSEEELIDRLLKAQKAKEIKHAKPKKTWKEIAVEVNWKRGISPKVRVKLLQDARDRLVRLQENDPDGILEKMRKRRETKIN